MNILFISIYPLIGGAALGFGSKVVLDAWGRHNERRAIAGALVGELAAYLVLMQPETSLPAYRSLATASRDARTAYLRALPEFPDTHPVFDKVADKIGYLPPEDARDVSRIYNVVTNFRLTMNGMSAPAFLDSGELVQTSRLISLTDLMALEIPIAETLIRRLRRVAGQTKWDWICLGND